MSVDRATFHIEESQLLSSLWYSDGSGHDGSSIGIDDVPEGWRIDSIKALGTGLVRFDIYKSSDE